MSIALAAAFTGAAAGDTISPSPIDFETTQGYVTGDINGQHGWTKTGGYDVAVANVSDFAAAAGYGFGAQALRLSDAVTSGSFGDQTFSPGLGQSAGESGQRHFDATFSIGTALAADQPGLHLSVSPDDGNGARMSYLRFEDQANGVHVFFDDATDSGPVGTPAAFSDTDIATLSPAHAYSIRFAIDFRPGPANDVVKIYIDGTLEATGTTWEDYYRYDPEQASHAVPAVSKLLFREAGTAAPDDLHNGFLVDGVSLSSSMCRPTGFVRDGIDLTAAQIGGDVTGDLDATGCNIGVYYGPGTSGSVTGANIHGANYFGVVAEGAEVSVQGSSIHDIGEVPFNGAQHGNAVFYVNGASGTISGNTVSRYQKNGITIRDSSSASVLNNTVTGEGPISYIAQNGIQISFGSTASVIGNTVSGNYYVPADVTACGLLFFQAAGVKQSKNTLFANETNLCNAGRGGGNTSA